MPALRRTDAREHDLSRTSLEALLGINTPAFCIKGFATSMECFAFAAAMRGRRITTLRNKPWTPVMEPGKPSQSYGLSATDHEGMDTLRCASVAGDVATLKGRNLHEVSPGLASATPGRLQFGAFMGRMPDGALALFS
ncbi:MAG: hypothetical protein FJX59_15250 [Alphaproteobacteria bacterium]|nr:hypothetical protein [Alphaproteobacteria bacterium]